MRSETCGTCKWCDVHPPIKRRVAVSDTSAVEQEEPAVSGYCHGWGPTMVAYIGKLDDWPMTCWPVVQLTDFCPKHEPRQAERRDISRELQGKVAGWCFETGAVVIEDPEEDIDLGLHSADQSIKGAVIIKLDTASSRQALTPFIRNIEDKIAEHLKQWWKTVDVWVQLV